MILDEQVPTADPGELIIQYTPFIYRIARRYKNALDNQPAIDEDDLLQAGRIAVYNCQKQYNPEQGSFLTYIFNRVRGAMCRVLGFDSKGNLKMPDFSLDDPINDDGDTFMDFLPDTTPTAEEKIVEQDEQEELAEAVHAAIDRLKNPKHRETIQRIWIDGQDKETAAEEMGCSIAVLQNIDLQARYKLHRDMELKSYAKLRYPSIHVGINRFNSTWTSSTEAALLWRERRFDYKYGSGAFVAVRRQDPDNVQTSIEKRREHEQ